MPDSLWTTVKKASDVCGRFPPRDDMPPPGETSVRDYFDLLRHEGRPYDAVVFLAHLLPVREAIWWGCLCSWQSARSKPTPAVDAVLGALVRWVREPSEANRVTGALLAGDDAPVQFLARALEFSGASLSPPGLPVVPPPPFLAHRTVAGALLLDAAKGGPERLRDFLQWGTDVADGKNRWN